MKNILSKLVFLSLIFSMGSCCERTAVSTSPIKYSSIDRVFMHDPGVYSFLYKDEVTNQLISVNKKNYCCWKYHVYADVKAEDFCWAEVDEMNSVMSIHIHNASEIHGGAWNHGKAGSGSTSPVE